MQIEWQELMQAGLGRLGLRPVEFWNLTPGELVMMLGEPVGRAPLTRDRLEVLAASFPDDRRKKNDD